MRSIKFIIAAGLISAFPAFADDETQAGPDMRPYVYIDAKAIENKTDNPGANFKGLIDRLDNGLTECGIYRVINSKSISEGTKDDDIFSVVGDDGGKASKIETPAMKIYMTIMQYGFASSGGTDMYGNASATRQAKIELILKVVDMRTKQTLKSKNISRSATGVATAQANLNEQVLQEANKTVVNDIIAELIKLTPFNVLDVSEGEVVIDAPPASVKTGMQLVVYKKGRAVKNRRTGRVTARQKKVAVIGVVTIAEDSVTCKLLDGKITPDEDAEEGDEYIKYVVKIPEAAQAAAAVPAAAPVAAPAQSSAASPF